MPGQQRLRGGRWHAPASMHRGAPTHGMATSTGQDVHAGTSAEQANAGRVDPSTSQPPLGMSALAAGLPKSLCHWSQIATTTTTTTIVAASAPHSS
mmetsp:Transcript_11489/g.31347  ORF Transcript_11489/g.31347 Transcript_11489/m.31347 type:complete len:96 (+) Transcript_11489:1432-1719(+)